MVMNLKKYFFYRINNLPLLPVERRAERRSMFSRQYPDFVIRLLRRSVRQLERIRAL